jgi:AraC family transcriptional regulator
VSQGLVTTLLSGPAGEIEFAGSEAHVLTVHAAGRIDQTLRLEGRVVRRRLAPGVIDLIPAGAGASFLDEGANAVLVLAMAPSAVRQAQDELQARPEAIGPAVGIDDTRLAGLVWALHRGEGATPGLYRDCLALEVLQKVVWAHGTTPGPAALDRRRLRRVFDYIEAHLDQPIAIQQLAVEAGLGPTAFKEAFRRTFGAPVHRFVVRRRSERARMLLLEGSMPASQVALEAGFSHQSHMARWLKRLYGVLPSELARG